MDLVAGALDDKTSRLEAGALLGGLLAACFEAEPGAGFEACFEAEAEPAPCLEGYYQPVLKPNLGPGSKPVSKPKLEPAPCLEAY